MGTKRKENKYGVRVEVKGRRWWVATEIGCTSDRRVSNCDFARLKVVQFTLGSAKRAPSRPPGGDPDPLRKKRLKLTTADPDLVRIWLGFVRIC